jgi:GGDEF domain-containing protein
VQPSGAAGIQVAMPEAPFGARRPHPVADVPPAALADGQAPAKGWLLALVSARPLRDAPALHVPALARDAPALCAAVLRAVGSEAELRRLQSGGDLAGLAARAGELAGAGGPAGAVAAVAALRGALWEALTTTMAPLDGPTTAALAERLAFVCDAVAAATLGAVAPAGASASRGAVGSPGVVASRGAAASPGVVAPLRAGAAPGASASPGASVSTGASAPTAADAPPGADAPPAQVAPTSGDDDVASFRVRDARGDWEGAVERLAAGARPFALLAVEVDDAPRLAAADPRGAAEALARVERAVRGELRPGDVLGREEDGRLWIVAADLGATGARALAERLADAIAAVPPVRGAALTTSIGLAASPAGGADRDELTARAEESLYAARAAGVPIA